MSRLIWHVTMSVDGFIAGPDHEMDWAFGHGGPSALADATRDATGAILGGRRWYDVAKERYDGKAGIYGGKWDGPVFVLTHRPAAAPDDEGIRFVSDGLRAAVATAAKAAGGRAVQVFGADVARQCLGEGLLDEIVIHLAPVLLGDGVRLYGGDGAPQVRLEGELTDLRYAVQR